MTASWTPTAQEKEALKRHGHASRFRRVDDMWPWLANRYGNVTAVDAPHAAHPERFSFRALAELIATAAAAFRAQGILENNVVALFSENSPRWLVADQGLMRCGAADAVRGASTPVEELRYILGDSKATALVVQNADLWRRLNLTLDQQSRLTLVLQLEGEPVDKLTSWDEFLSSGVGGDPIQRPTELKEKSEVASKQLATIFYTSGTTGQPKGVPLTHANLLHQIRSLACVACPKPGSPVLSVLPIWHAYERSASYYFLSCACTQTYTTIKHLKKDLPRVKPVAMATVPRLWESVQISFNDAAKDLPSPLRLLFRIALSNSSAQRQALRRAKNLVLEPVSWLGRLQAFGLACLRWPLHTVASALLWPKLRQQLSGGQLAYPISGGGAIAPHIDAFFEAVGIELLVGYGLNETSPVISCRRPWRNIRSSSGQPMPDTELRVVDPESGVDLGYRQQGKILVRGPQVMSGYWGKPEITKKVLNDDGWFDTGDLGLLLADGSIALTGRAKDTIVLSSGENIEPGPLEQVLVASPLIEQVMLIGQDERQLGALIVPHNEAIIAWASQKGLSLAADLGGNPGSHSLLRLLVTECNRLLGRRTGARADERLAGVALVEPFSIDNGLLTQTLKQRRHRILERDAVLIKGLYARRQQVSVSVRDRKGRFSGD
ncbi:AMP-binding protein [Synechococcus sp. M16CYN]|uniref:AMP-binding protein n=1 Tax=Synechococcus sp. M16CYN TaxID=3103139 RepID=UPI003250D3BC